MRKSLATLLALIMLVSLGAAEGRSADPASPPPPRTMMDHYRLAAGAEAEGDLAAARDHFRAGLALVPQSPHLLLGLARTSAALADEAACLGSLQKFAALGATFDLGRVEAFGPFLENPEFAAVAAAIARNGEPQAPARVAITLHEPEMWTEGIACDLKTGDLFAGSVMLAKLVRLRDGREEEFGTSAQDGLQEILGLDIDEARRTLWAITGLDQSEPGAKHDFGEAPRANSVVVYDLETGAQVADYPMVEDGRIHLWNDVTVAVDGTAYFSDLAASEIYRIAPGGGPELFFAGVDYQYFNGIVAGDDGRLVYAAALEGVVVIDTADGSASLLECPADLYTGLGDGMALRGRDLFIVQNNDLLNQRILHCRLDDSGRKVAASAVLACGLPAGLMAYTCALGEGVLYVNGTAPFAQYDDSEPPPNPVIVAVPLDPGGLSAMFLLFGWGRHDRDLGPAGHRTCAHCNNHVQFRRTELSNRLTVFFIPVLTLNRTRWEVCPICQRGYETRGS